MAARVSMMPASKLCERETQAVMRPTTAKDLPHWAKDSTRRPYAGFWFWMSGVPTGIRRPRPPRLLCPPLRPAARASSGVHSCAVPFSWAARPPLLAISRCFSRLMEANPRRSLRAPSTVTPSLICIPPAGPTMSGQGLDARGDFKLCASATEQAHLEETHVNQGLSKFRTIAASHASDVESDRRGQRLCKSGAAN